MSAWVLQQAVFAALSDNAALAALVGNRIFDGVPETAALPYLVLSEASETAATDGAITHTLSLHIWSRAGGTREVKQIAAVVRACLDGAALSLAGQALIDLRFASADYSRQSDGKTFRAVLRFAALTEPL